MLHALSMPLLQTTFAFDPQPLEHAVPVGTAQHMLLPGSVQSLGPRHSIVKCVGPHGMLGGRQVLWPPTRERQHRSSFMHVGPGWTPHAIARTLPPPPFTGQLDGALCPQTWKLPAGNAPEHAGIRLHASPGGHTLGSSSQTIASGAQLWLHVVPPAVAQQKAPPEQSFFVTHSNCASFSVHGGASHWSAESPAVEPVRQHTWFVTQVLLPQRRLCEVDEHCAPSVAGSGQPMMQSNVAITSLLLAPLIEQ
jgi:hypothetical protein